MAHPLPTVALAAVAFLVASPATSEPRTTSDDDLLALDERLMQAQIVDRDPTQLRTVGHERMRVLAPGGMVENKEQVIRGLTAWDVKSIKLSGREVVRDGDTAIVIGRLDIDGVMRPVGRWGPIKFVATYVQRDGEWKLLARSLTPCLDQLIKIGRC